MYVSVFFGVLPTIERAVVQMQCIVSQYSVNTLLCIAVWQYIMVKKNVTKEDRTKNGPSARMQFKFLFFSHIF